MEEGGQEKKKKHFRLSFFSRARSKRRGLQLLLTARLSLCTCSESISIYMRSLARSLFRR